MSDPKLTVVIAAQNKAEATIKEVNDQVGGLAVPINKTNKRLGDLATPVKKVHKEVGDLATPVKKVHKEVGGLIAPFKKATEALETLRGGSVLGSAEMMGGFGRIAGGVAGVAAAASLAGSAAFRGAEAWARYTRELGFGAARSGVMAQSLAALEGAAGLAGAAAGTMTNSMIALTDTLHDIRGGRANEALLYLRDLGISVDGVLSGATKAEELFPQLAAAISRIADPTDQARIATVFFGASAEEMLKLIRRGPAAVAEYVAAAKAHAGATTGMTKEADEFARAEKGIEEAMTGLSHSIFSKFAPGIAHVMEEMTKMIDNFTSLVDKVKLPDWFNRLMGLGGGLQVPVPVETPPGEVDPRWGIVIPRPAGAAPAPPSATPGAVAPGASSGDTRPDRTNNPGSLDYVAGQPGVTGSDGRLGVYPDMTSGVAAAMRQYLLYQDRDGLHTIRQMIERATPRSENPNVDAYEAAVAAELGVSVDSPVDLHNRGTGMAYMQAVARQEGSRRVTPADIAAGVDRALSWLPGAPAAAPAPAQANGRVQVDVRIAGGPPGTTATAAATGAVAASAPRVDPTGVGR